MNTEFDGKVKCGNKKGVCKVELSAYESVR